MTKRLEEAKKKYHTANGMHPISIGCGRVPRKLINRRVKIPPVLFTRNLSFKKKA